MVRFGSQKKTVHWLKALVPTLGLTVLGGSLLGHAVMNREPIQIQAQKELTEADLAGPLKEQGLQGLVHGAVSEESKYVFSYRDPNNFFKEFMFPLIPTTDALEAQLKTLNRHDTIRVKGRFINEPKHILLTEITVVKKFEDATSRETSQHPVGPIPEDLKDKTELTGFIHAMLKEGRQVVVDYQNGVYPVVVKNPQQSKHLWRGDKVKIRYTVQEVPDRPPHLVVQDDDPAKGIKGIEVIEPITAFHGTNPFTFKGPLVLFKKSPVLQKNIWAVEIKGDDGLKRYFTLSNFEDKADWEKLDKQFQDWWDAKPDGIVETRNRRINPNVIIEGQGEIPALPTEEDAKTEEEKADIREVRQLSVNQAFLAVQLGSKDVKVVSSEENLEK